MIIILKNDMFVIETFLCKREYLLFKFTNTLLNVIKNKHGFE